MYRKNTERYICWWHQLFNIERTYSEWPSIRWKKCILRAAHAHAPKVEHRPRSVCVVHWNVCFVFVCPWPPTIDVSISIWMKRWQLNLKVRHSSACYGSACCQSLSVAKFTRSVAAYSRGALWVVVRGALRSPRVWSIDRSVRIAYVQKVFSTWPTLFRAQLAERNLAKTQVQERILCRR